MCLFNLQARRSRSVGEVSVFQRNITIYLQNRESTYSALQVPPEY
jgi:hypothetical protein